MSKSVKDENNLICQFCGEGSFDLIGLKGHIQHGWCQVFNEIPNVRVAIIYHRDSVTASEVQKLIDQ